MTRIDSALVLAAGRGMRLGPRGREIPKGFLEIGGVTLIERAISLLRAAGIVDVTIVTGHLAERYDALAERLGGGVRTVFNPDYATLGSGHSLAVGLAATRGDVVMLESDVIWEAAALDAVLAAPHASAMLTSGPTAGGDEVWVWAEGEAERPLLHAMSKRLDALAATPFGELVGITGLGEALRAALPGEIARATAANPMADYESCLVAATRREPLDLLHVADLAWAEIDDEGMYRRTRDAVWPRIRARDAARAGSGVGASDDQ